jgi:hypothetical protein
LQWITVPRRGSHHKTNDLLSSTSTSSSSSFFLVGVFHFDNPILQSCLPARALNSLIPSTNPYKLRTQTHYTQNPNMHSSCCRPYQQAASNQAIKKSCKQATITSSNEQQLQ